MLVSHRYSWSRDERRES